jgi:hypothetical protein
MAKKKVAPRKATKKTLLIDRKIGVRKNWQAPKGWFKEGADKPAPKTQSAIKAKPKPKHRHGWMDKRNMGVRLLPGHGFLIKNSREL